MIDHKVQDRSRKFFTILPNLIDNSDLSVHAFRLYAHLKRVAGEDGECWQSTGTLAKHCRMASGSVTKAKRELVKNNLIRIEELKNPGGGRKKHLITIADIWAENMAMHPEVHQVKSEVHPMNVTSSPGEIKKNPTKKNPTKKNQKDNNAAPAAKPLPYTDTQRQFLELFGAKRFRTRIAADTIRALEERYGSDDVLSAGRWAAKRQMNVGGAVVAVESALKKGWNKPRATKRSAEPRGYAGLREWAQEEGLVDG